ncbi:MAG: S-layer homology domain-containing protein [Oscillospiraceae bacterium]|nr:S-layer homology domain-containing protein [Oscillospiraceae bacterium]
MTSRYMLQSQKKENWSFTKTLMIILCVAVLSSLCGPFSLAADTASISVGQASAKPGESITISISLDSNPGIAALNIKIEYDSTRLRIDNQNAIARGPALGFLTFVGANEVTYGNNPFSAIWYGAMNETSTGTLLNVTFTVLANAPSGLAYVRANCDSGDVLDLYEEQIPISIMQGSVNVSSGSGDTSDPQKNTPPTPPPPVANTPIEQFSKLIENAVVQFEDVKTLPDNFRALIADRPVFSIQADATGSLAKVSIPYTLKVGQMPESLLVYHIDSSDSLSIVKLCLYDEADSRLKMIGSVGERYMIGESKISFTDVAENAWYYRAVSFGAARKLFEGVGNNLFAPQGTMTRAMFITVLANFDGEDVSKYTNSPFTDVNIESWYGTKVTWAMENGLLDGGILVGTEPGTFDPNGFMTREQLAVLLDNYITYKDLTVPEVTGNALEFSDIEQASEWSRSSIRNMRTYGTLAGVGNNLFSPKGETTRAEMAQILYNLISVLVS